MLPPRLLTACSALPPEGAAAPVARRSRFHGPCLKGMLPPRSSAARNSLPPEGAAAPAVWRSQSRGPCLNGEPPWLLTACSALHLAGRRLPEASLLSPVQSCPSSFGAAGSSPEGAAAPVARRSRFHGPCLQGMLPPQSQKVHFLMKTACGAGASGISSYILHSKHRSAANP